MWLFAFFVGVPLIEIALFISVGGAIGLWPTLAIVIVTAFIGTIMVRKQGSQALAQLQTALHSARDPSKPLAEGAMILFSGALLLTPGFFTDAVGFALLIPSVRAALFARLSQRLRASNASPFQQRTAQGDVIDGDFENVNPEPDPHNTRPINSFQSSGWTRPPGADS